MIKFLISLEKTAKMKVILNPVFFPTIRLRDSKRLNSAENHATYL